MTLVASGNAIAMGGNVVVSGFNQSIEYELKASYGNTTTGTSQIGMNDSAVRGLAGIASGQISMGNLYGKSAFTPGSQTFTANGTYTVPTGYSQLMIEVWGAGGGGGGATNSGTSVGGAGAASSVTGTGLTTMTANGGSGATAGGSGSGGGGAGGTASGGTSVNTPGTAGQAGSTVACTGGNGGSGANGGSGGSGQTGLNGAGGAGNPPGGGGGGAAALFPKNCHQSYGGGGGGGGYAKTIISSLTVGTVLTITVGTGGASGTGVYVGGAGALGQVTVSYS